MIGFEPGFEARVVADDVRFNIPDYLLQAALDASYAAKDHTHTADQISGLEGALGSYLTKTDAAATYEPLITNSITYSDDIDNDQSRFFWLNLSGQKFRASWAGIRNKLQSYFDTVYAKVTHSHSIAQVSGLQDQLNSKITSDGRAYPRRVGGGNINFNWSGQGGQPTWLWGGNGDGTDMYVWNPANFSVNYANSTWNSERLQGWDIAGIQNDAQGRANGKARKAASWGQWNFTSHDQRIQNGMGENVYFTARITGTYADTVQLQISPNNVDYWTVGTTTTAGNSINLEYTSGCLPPGWWMRLIRGSGNYNANVILVW